MNAIERISEKGSYLEDGTRSPLTNFSQPLENHTVPQSRTREMLDDEDSQTQFRNDNLLQDRTRPHLTNLSRCLENYKGF
jgi:hypothetical protein